MRLASTPIAAAPPFRALVGGVIPRPALRVAHRLVAVDARADQGAVISDELRHALVHRYQVAHHGKAQPAPEALLQLWQYVFEKFHTGQQRLAAVKCNATFPSSGAIRSIKSRALSATSRVMVSPRLGPKQ
jgi:hypothetical protein